ncbi:FAD:protein FMN transferase [Phenylobacterium kunshanense]|uniref:FAD:protein FMN transferase n=1 Tax=Phenylobacterium kunshanense TaxID=1445034 RepID=UPI001F0CB1FB|nr:FAD:protein FMN transferase [Phenylobacterium kunshanense]
MALEGPTMGVAWTLQALVPPGVSDAAIATAVQASCDSVVAEMSTWEPASDLCRFNRAPAGTWSPAGAHLMTVLRAAAQVADESGGAFDPTIGDLVDAWGFGPPGPVARLPEPEASQSLAKATWRSIKLDEALGLIRQPGGVRLDLCGIAKGYGVDLAAQALRALGLRDFLIEIGGELRGEGVKGDGEPWWVEVERPPGASLPEEPLLVALHGLSIASSGDWRRAFTAGGRSYSHTIDPRAGAPVAGDIAAATVIHEDCMMADAYCTALIASADEAESFASRHDLAALIVRREARGFREHATPALERLLA